MRLTHFNYNEPTEGDPPAEPTIPDPKKGEVEVLND